MSIHFGNVTYYPWIITGGKRQELHSFSGDILGFQRSYLNYMNNRMCRQSQRVLNCRLYNTAIQRYTVTEAVDAYNERIANDGYSFPRNDSRHSAIINKSHRYSTNSMCKVQTFLELMSSYERKSHLPQTDTYLFGETTLIHANKKKSKAFAELAKFFSCIAQ